MNKGAWQRCTDPREMLRELSVFSECHRKFRLFCCAYCRWFFWDYLPPGIRNAIEIAEAYADQAVSKYKLKKAQDTFYVGKMTNAEWRANLVAQLATSPLSPYRSACMLLDNRNTLPWKGGKKAVAHLMREIFGYPFGSALTIPAPILAWNDEIVPRLVQDIYADRAFDRLPILADALEEAGCNNKDILKHCRSGEDHARGCWLLDLILTGN